MNKINVIILPSVVFISLVLGGCTKDEVTVTPSGGVYVSASAGANFDQSVQTTITGEDISQFDLGKIHRALQDANTVFMAAGEKGMVRSKDDGEIWEVISTSLFTTIDIALMKNGVLLAAGIDTDGQGSVMRSIDDGKSWQNVFTLPLPVVKKRFQIISGGSALPTSIVALEVDPRLEDKVWAGTNDGTLFSAESSGQVWKTITELSSASEIITGDRSDAGVVRMEVSSTTPDELFIVTQKKQLIRLLEGKATVIKVPESVTTPSPYGIVLDSRNILDVSFIPGFPNALLLGTDKGAVTTKDGAKSFGELKLPFDASKIVSTMVVAVSPTNSNRMLFAADGIVYRSEDGGTAWHTTSVGPVGFAITDISINPKNASRVLAVLKAIVN
ncbi:MAG TPA: hypothetical protein VJI96_03885 [Candidatus Andersenbacteria bacterium]|nr:hypothetical protein [Candidatus Andersenbacteria bacterium]